MKIEGMQGKPSNFPQLSETGKSGFGWANLA
jgi:hypothetical protein